MSDENNSCNEKRFAFGKNWQRFLSVLNEERISSAVKSLKDMVMLDDFKGKTFLDIGSGSGLFSLAAMRLGAERVHSFDCDPQAVACSLELKRRYCLNTSNWTIKEGNILDTGYLASLGQWNIVYAWGVLHHTGAMRKALENVIALVKNGGYLFIAIYNDQGGASRRWLKVKKIYNTAPKWARLFIVIPIMLFFESKYAIIHMIRSRDPFKEWRVKSQSRGMSKFYDWVDWIGGYPFEVAKPEEIFDFYHSRGFMMERIKTCGGSYGCNEFVFKNIGSLS